MHIWGNDIAHELHYSQRAIFGHYKKLSEPLKVPWIESFCDCHSLKK